MDDRWFGSVITVVIRLRQLDEFADNSCLECQLPGFEYFMAFRLDWIAIAGATKKWSRETAAGRRLAAVESAQKKIANTNLRANQLHDLEHGRLTDSPPIDDY